MPLQRATKSVIFHDGIADGTDRFLVEPPALDYAENVHPHKDGSYQKRPGFGPDALTTVPSAQGSPFFVHSVGDTLYVFTEDGAQAYDGTWETLASNGYVGTRETVVETQSQVGATQFQHVPAVDSSGDIVRHWVAYEVLESQRNQAFASTVPEIRRHIILVEFDVEGKFVKQDRIEDAFAPILKTTEGANDDGNAYLFYVEEDTYIMKLALRGSALTIFTLGTGFSTDVRQGYPLFATGTGVDFQGWAPRLGQGEDNVARWHVAWVPGASRWLVAYQSNAKVGIKTFNEVGQQDGNDPLLTAGQMTPYAVTYTSDNFINGTEQVILLYATWNVDVTNEWSLRVRTIDVAAGLCSATRDVAVNSGTNSPDDGDAPTFINGTLANTTSSSTAMIAVTEAGASGYTTSTNPSAANLNAADPAAYKQNTYNVRDATAGIRFYWYNYGTDTLIDSEVLHGHRIVTNMLYDGSTWQMGIQQWADYTPMSKAPSVVVGVVDVPPALKPVTTILCDIRRDVAEDAILTRPIAYLNAGNSQSGEYVQSELRTNLQNLHRIGDDLWCVNRVIRSVSDIAYSMGLSSAGTSRLSGLDLGSKAAGVVHRIRKGWNEDGQINTANFGDGVLMSTAVPLWFDQSFFAEASPLDSPEIMRVEPITVGDYIFMNQFYGVETQTDVVDGDWQKMVSIYGYVDARGNVHRSAPSSTLYISRDAEPTAIRVYVTPPISVMPDAQEYFCEIYISAGPDDDPQLASTTTVPCDGIWHAVELEVSLFDRWYDAGALTGEKTERTTQSVYTQGGTLAADPWPTFSLVVGTSTRIFAIDEHNRGRVLPSKLFEDFIAPEYNSTLAINLGDERNLTAIGKLDDKVVVFEPNDIHVIYGEGPDNRGQGQDFAVHYISTDVGCQDQQSVIETPAGLLFYSKPRGFYMIDRNLQVRFIGDGVEEIARDIDVVAANLVSEFGEVRFIVSPGTLTPTFRDELVEEAPQAVLDAGVDQPPRPITNNSMSGAYPCLVYNYEKNAWTTYSNYRGVAATLYQNKYTMLNEDWTIWQESATRFDDPVGNNRMILRTPWIRLSEQIQNYARLWRVTFLGRYLSSLQDLGGGIYEAGDVVVRAWFDYEAGVAPQFKQYRFQDFGFDPFDAVPLRGERFQFKWTPERGRCQAVKFEILEVNSTDRGEGLTYATGAGFEIVSADIEVGVEGMQTRYLAAGVSK